jgi:serine/threonine protein kinase/WD40 repeat protein
VRKRSIIDSITTLSARWKGDPTTAILNMGTPARALAAGDRWGEFQIVEKLGQGAFGTVYHARDALDREVALKLLDSNAAIREGKVLAQLRHPNIVSVYGYVQIAEGAALSMELIQGQSLEKLSAERGNMDPGYTALVCLQVCRGLALVHAKGLVHRDIKGSNVMRQADGRIVVVDFGLGQKLDPDHNVAEFAGTLPYMAPEMFRGAPASPKTDLYAVGVLLYHLITRQYPLRAETVAEYREAHEKGRREHLLDVRPDLPPALIEVVEKATHADPEKRFKSAGAMVHALEGVLQAQRKRFAAPIWAIGVAVVAAGTFLVWRNFRTRPEALPTEFVPLTSEEALSEQPSLSADGTLLTYSSDEADPGNTDIWLRKLPNGASIKLTHDKYDDGSPALSPDGHWVAFRSEKDGGGVYVIPAFGGDAKLLAKGASMPRFSPDGTYISYWVGEFGHPRLPNGKIYIVPVAGGAPRQLGRELADARNPVWAPDSQHLLFQGSTNPQIPPDEDADWWLVALDGSPAVNTHALTAFQAQGLEVHTYTAVWTPDYLVFSAARNVGVNVWRARFPVGGKPGVAQRMTVGTGFETSPWLGPNGLLVFESKRGRLRIWRVDLAHPGAPSSRVTNTDDLDAFPSLSRDSKWLAFTRASSQLGTRQVWTRDLESGAESALTTDNLPKSYAVISPDGSKIAYDAGEKENTSVYVTGRLSRETRLVCRNCGTVSAWTPASDSLLISAASGIMQVDPASGTARAVLSKPGQVLEEGEISPDGKWMAFTASVPGGDRAVFVTPFGHPGEWTKVSPEDAWADKPHWSPNGDSLYYYSGVDGFACIWSRTIDRESGKPSRPPRAVSHTHSSRMFALNISQPVRGFAVGEHTVVLNLAENSASIWISADSRK